LDETENMLYQMILYTGGGFDAAQLQASPKAPEYFNSNCKLSSCGILVDAHLSFSSGQLKKNPTILHWPIKARLDELNVVSDEEATATARLVERCLRLDPALRPTAAELLSDRWFNGVE
jgi:serine/threonine protein kinase